MSRGSTPRLPLVPERVLQRFTPQGDTALLREIEECVARDMAAVIRRGQGPAFSIVRNDTCLLVRPHPLWGRQPIGTYQDTIRALWAGDRWIEGPSVEDDDHPRGAA